MKEVEIHQRENNEDTESFLQENITKFQSDAVFLLGLMIKGEKLTAKTVVQKYGCEPRRLRDLQISGKCEKQWVCDENGKRKYVEYFVTPSQPMTKSELISKTHEAQKNLQRVESNLVVVMTLPDDPPQYQQQTLFP